MQLIIDVSVCFLTLLFSVCCDFMRILKQTQRDFRTLFFILLSRPIWYFIFVYFQYVSHIGHVYFIVPAMF